MNVTEKVAEYVDEMGINIAELSRKTQIPYDALYTSLKRGTTRKLSADEFLLICKVLKRSPEEIVEG